MASETDKAVFYLLLGGVMIQLALIGMLLYEVHTSNALMREVREASTRRSAWESVLERRLTHQEELVERVLPRVERTLSQLLQQMED